MVTKTSHLPIRNFLALLWAHPILHNSTIRVNIFMRGNSICQRYSWALPHFQTIMNCPYDVLCPNLWWRDVNKHVIFTFSHTWLLNFFFYNCWKNRSCRVNVGTAGSSSLIVIAIAFILDISHQLNVFCWLWSDLQTFTIDPQHRHCCVVSLLSLYRVHVESFLCLPCKGKKGKAIPLRAWTSPECSRMLRLSDFETNDTWRW